MDYDAIDGLEEAGPRVTVREVSCCHLTTTYIDPESPRPHPAMWTSPSATLN